MRHLDQLKKIFTLTVATLSINIVIMQNAKADPPDYTNILGAINSSSGAMATNTGSIAANTATIAANTTDIPQIPPLINTTNNWLQAIDNPSDPWSPKFRSWMWDEMWSAGMELLVAPESGSILTTFNDPWFGPSSSTQSGTYISDFQNYLSALQKSTVSMNQATSRLYFCSLINARRQNPDGTTNTGMPQQPLAADQTTGQPLCPTPDRWVLIDNEKIDSTNQYRINDLSFMSVVNPTLAPYTEAAPPDAQTPQNYVAYAAGLNTGHIFPQKGWQGSVSDMQNYENYFNTVTAIQSYGTYILNQLSGSFDPRNPGKNLTSFQNTLIADANNKDWINQVLTFFPMGYIFRQMLVYTAQNFSVNMQILQNLQSLAASQAMTNTLLIAQYSDKERVMLLRATGVMKSG
jgi:hypothetical protein